ncbi:MAG: nucleotidyltransferase domain-containing protein [Clostridia bacterium]|nr:nucleotidyltransferase domain-containing protein [Clostridia bacterium]
MMPEHLRRLLDVYLRVIRERYAADVSLLLVYGSAVNGTADERSDLDVLCIPKTPRGWELAQTFLLDGVGQDMWCADWTVLERMADFDDTRLSILLDSQTAYIGADEDLARLNTLRARARAMLAGAPLYDKTAAHLERAEACYGRLCIRFDWTTAGELLSEAADAWCILHRTYLRFGIKRLPPKLASLTDGDFMRNAASLLSDLRAMLPKPSHKPTPGLYEELASTWNKLRRACGQGDTPCALLAASGLQNETGVDLLSAFNPRDLSKLRAAADSTEAAYLDTLNANNIPVRRYTSLEKLEQFYNKEGNNHV